MFDKLLPIINFIEKVSVVTPAVIADLQKLLDDAKQPLVSSTADPQTPAEMVAAFGIGNDRVQRVSGWFVNDLGKDSSQAVVETIQEDGAIAATLFAKLQIVRARRKR